MMAYPIRSLDARYYTDPAVFELAKAGLLASTWQFGCHTAELAEAGSYKSFEIAGESLFAICGRDGQIRVFYNVCQHRAHQLVEGAGTARVIVCPNHAWTYELTGRLRAGPNIAARRDLPDGAALRKLPGVSVREPRPHCPAHG